MKPIIIFFSLFLIPLFADDLKSGFGEEYYKLDIDQKRQIFFIKMNEMFDQSFKKIEQERAFIEAFFKDAYKTGFRTSNQINLEKLITIKNKYR
ncbi:mannosyl-glycoprotein endo-beta-N-acetylglucosamidase, partial [Campylobacter coli]